MALKDEIKKNKGTKGTAPGVDGTLTRAVWHKGRMYDPKNEGDVEAFAKLLAADKTKDNAQRLADKGVIEGFGTKAAKTEP